MSDKIFSRAYLQSIPDDIRREQKKRTLATICETCSQGVVRNAKEGMTSYMYDTWGRNQASLVTVDDIVGAFKQMFPDCTVKFQEVWVDTIVNSQVIKRGILIDWS